MRVLVIDLITDVVAIGVVAYGIYFRRYYRRDLLLAYCALNFGVFAVTALLTRSSAGVGLGLGLFGILSIIRLRSESITQQEIAYYFVVLALGLITGLQAGPLWLAPVLAALLAAMMYIVDHPRLAAGSQRQTITLDRAYLDRDVLTAVLQRLLGAEVRHLVVLQIDLVADTTLVDVRYRSAKASHGQLEAVVAAKVNGATA
jgi:hypothetical protein